MRRTVAAASGHVTLGNHAFQPDPRIEQHIGNRQDNGPVCPDFERFFLQYFKIGFHCHNDSPCLVSSRPTTGRRLPAVMRP